MHFAHRDRGSILQNKFGLKFLHALGTKSKQIWMSVIKHIYESANYTFT